MTKRTEQDREAADGPAPVHERPKGGPSGLSTGLQPGGEVPGGGPAAGQGSLGTGQANTGGDSGSMKRGGR